MRERLGIVLVVVALIGAACGDDDTGEAAADHGGRIPR